MGSITLTKVNKTFGDMEVIPSIDLEIKEGEFVVFVGPSGCGKSTLLRLIAGLEDVSSGVIEIDGEDATRIAPAKRGLAMVFQSYALYPHMSVRKNIAFPLKMAGMDQAEIDKRVATAADVLNLTDYLERRPGQLSGGQRQRVAIGRAIVREPAAFLFDEPLSNLDAALRVNMRLEITELHHKLKTTMIYVTHDQVEAMTMADKIVVLNAGRIEQVGSPLELYHIAAQPVRRRLHRLAEDELRQRRQCTEIRRRYDRRAPRAPDTVYRERALGRISGSRRAPRVRHLPACRCRRHRHDDGAGRWRVPGTVRRPRVADARAGQGASLRP